MTELIKSVENLAVQAGEMVLPFFATVDPEIKADGSWLTEADTKVHDQLTQMLPKIIDLPVLSEELNTQQQQYIIDNSEAGYWCIDPLDGTSNFTKGIPYWCVSIALIQNGIITLGVVYDPNRRECFAAQDERPSTINGVEIVTTETTALADAMALIDLKRISSKVAIELVTNGPYRSQRSFGASALDICWIAADRCQIYLHGKQRLWDYAAATKILMNASGEIETFEGQDLFQNDLGEKQIIAGSSSKIMNLWREYYDQIK